MINQLSQKYKLLRNFEFNHSNQYSNTYTELSYIVPPSFELTFKSSCACHACMCHHLIG